MNYELVTTPKIDGSIYQELRFYDDDFQEMRVNDEQKERIMQWIVHTREEQIRQALIALGWTPPPTPSPLR